jgi:hypothetical protein
MKAPNVIAAETRVSDPGETYCVIERFGVEAGFGSLGNLAEGLGPAACPKRPLS